MTEEKALVIVLLLGAFALGWAAALTWVNCCARLHP